MRVKGIMGRLVITVLVESGSTHNFLSNDIAKKLGLKSRSEGYFEVANANGEKLISSGRCKEVCMTLQGVPIVVDLYLLPLEGCDTLLGAQWLRMLGPIIWDFSKHQMTFQIGDKDVALQGMPTPENKLVTAEGISREMKKKKQGVLLQLYSLSINRSAHIINSHLQQLLISYTDVFGEPKGLPPPWSHDHKIPLAQVSGPLCVRPYRYPHFQKVRLSG